MTYVILRAIDTYGRIKQALVDEDDLRSNDIKDYFPVDYTDVEDLGKVTIEGDVDLLAPSPYYWSE